MEVSRGLRQGRMACRTARPLSPTRGASRLIARAVALSLLAVPLQTFPLLAQGTGTITGTVRDRAADRPLEGARLSVVGTRLGDLANAQGSFTIRDVTAGQVTVRAQFLGYEPMEESVLVPASGSVTVNFTLQRAAVALSGVVITATGAEQRRSVGTAMATLDTADIARNAAVNTQQLLAGSTPGVTVLANSGQPGTGGSIRLRGVNSVSQGNNPLIYVDGVRVFNGRTPTNVGGRQYSSPLNDIAAEDIDHIEIVRGPAATTLYGTEASGGVVQIFTKQGTNAAPSWQVGYTGGINNMGHVGPSSDPTGLFFNECRGDNLKNGLGVVFEDPTCPSSGSWLSNGQISRINLSVRGGAPNGVTYFVAGNADNERGVLPTGAAYGRGLRANISFKPASAFKVDVNSSVSSNKLVGFPDGNSSSGAMLNISRGPNGNYKGGGCANATATCVLNDSLFNNDVTNATTHYITGATLTWDPTTSWSNRFALGYDYNNAEINYISPFGDLRVPLGQYFQTLWTRQFLSADFASTYRRPLGTRWTTSTSVGAQMFDSRVYSTDLQANNFAGPGSPTLVSGSLRQITDVNQQRVINAGFFGQEQIGWRDVLFATVGVRVDGNSAFGKSFGLQTYPKVSASYVISDEAFWPRNFIESLKLRGAVGDAGKAPGAFDAVRTWVPVAAENGQPAFEPSQVGNPDLGPERTREVEMGFDAGALDGRIGMQYTYYNQKTLDALIPVAQAPSLGFAGTQLINAGELRNQGHEIQLTVEPVRTRNVNVSARVGLTMLKSEAGNVGGETLTIFALGRTFVREGYPVPSYIGLKVANPSEIADPVIEQDTYIGSVYPTRIWTPALTVRLWDRLTFDALGEWQLGGHNLNAVGYQNANLRVWQPCYAIQTKLAAAATGDASALSDVTAWQRAQCTIVSSQRDYSFWVERSDFFKLRSVSLTYALPKSVLHGIARNGSLVLMGRNLLTRTSYGGTDPEVSDQRDDTFARRDYYVFPTSRSFTASLRLTF